jgi:small-conductance mechanosensitive channel
LDAGKEAFAEPFTEVLQAVIDYLPNLATLIVILIFGWLFLRFMRYVFSSIGRGSLEIGDFPREWAEPTYRLLRTLYLIFLLMVSFPYLPGASSQFFQGFSVFVGALVTLGSAGAIGNVVAGTVLTYTRSFRVGDLVQIGGNTGIIMEKSLLVTRVRSALNEEITIPNSSVLASDVRNYISAAERTGLVLTVHAGIGYDVDWRTVHRLMKEAALQTTGITNEPEPVVLQTALGDYAVNYELRAWTQDAHRMIPVASELRANVLDCFNAAGVEIMTPSVQALRDASRLAVPSERMAVPSHLDSERPLRIDFNRRSSASCESQAHPGLDSATRQRWQRQSPDC